MHPSLLPSYRGPAPMQHALINGETKTGVSVIGMTEYKKGIDTGDIWREAEFVSSHPSHCLLDLGDRLRPFSL